MSYSGQSVRLRSSARTSVGQVRENNEDNIHLWARGPFVLAVVADGMGGAAAGEEASRLAVEAIKSSLILRADEALEALPEEQLTEELREAIQDGNDRIIEKAASGAEFRGMGTTITLAFVRGTSAVMAHVGDSRAYIVDGEYGHISQITSDHSFVEALLSAGHITREQAEEHPMRNVLYRALGQADDVDIDMYRRELHVGDRLVLCSDGLTRHVRPEEIARLTLEHRNPDTASQLLVDLANERGGEDNVSVIVISVEADVPAGSNQSAARIGDEDETLILAGRGDQQPGTSLHDLDTLVGLQPPPPPKPSDDPHGGHVPPQTSYKMTAERLSDDEIEDADDTLTDPLDRAIPTRHDALKLFPPYEPDDSPPPHPHEKQGEGRDTLMPDQ